MTTIFARTQFEGFHRWPDAPDEVAFLRDIHRHIFHVTAYAPVTHENRDIEFILFKRKLEAFIKATHRERLAETEGWSCETWARVIGEHFGCELVEVSEDGENGATWQPEDEPDLEPQ